jgi:t-SNARE complex subunit (syntaxin)
MSELTPEEIAAIVARLNDVIKQAQDLQADLKAKMSERTRRDQQDVRDARPSPLPKRRR